MPEDPNTNSTKKILIREHGPYKVLGGIPLVSKTQVVSEYGEPLAWKKDGAIQTEDEYVLCRCGQTQSPPFCDKTHRTIPFDGQETADRGPTLARQKASQGHAILVKKDASLCIDSGFCGMRKLNLARLLAESGDSERRSLLIAMLERCPSGSLTYRLENEPQDNEPDLPQQVAVITEITSDGPIRGPLWVTGSIPIEQSDGQLLELRNRVTLCNCGLSSNKPLCDGTHRNHPRKVG